MVKIGVIGCADIARRNVIPALLSLEDHYILSGVASRTKEKARQFANEFNIKSFIGYETLLNEEQLDAVYIPLPNSMHAEWIERALNNNLHVLVEKSMACSYEEVKYLNELASQRNLALVENFQFRFHNQLAVISDLINEGKIGEIRCVRSSFGFPPFSDPDNIRYNKELGGGALLDAGAYPLKITQIFLGQDIEVSSANLWYDEEKDVDIWGGAYLKQKKGPLFAEIAFGFDNFYQCNLELWGSEGMAYTNRIFTTPLDYSPEIILETNNGMEKIFIEPENHFKNMLKYFFKLINGTKRLDEEYIQNLNQARLLKELREKAFED